MPKPPPEKLAAALRANLKKRKGPPKEPGRPIPAPPAIPQPGPPPGRPLDPPKRRG